MLPLYSKLSRKRGEREQGLHDWVIQERIRLSYGKLRTEGHTICANLGQQHNCDVEGLYPDIVTFNRNTGRPIIIDEIETFVDEPEFEEWKPFGKLKLRFVVTVPATEIHQTIDEIERRTIPVNEIWTYSTDGVTIDFTKSPWPYRVATASEQSSLSIS